MALDWLAETEWNPGLELRLVGAFYAFWIHSGYWREGGRRTESVLTRMGNAATSQRARTLRQAAGFARRRGDAKRGKLFAEEALALHRKFGTGGEELFW